MWTWVSISPGISVRPPRSTTRGSTPFGVARSRPTAATRPSTTSTSVRSCWPPSPSTIRPPLKSVDIARPGRDGRGDFLEAVWAERLEAWIGRAGQDLRRDDPPEDRPEGDPAVGHHDVVAIGADLADGG